MQHVEQACRKARFKGQFTEAMRGQGRDFGGLRDDGVSHEQGRRDLPREQIQRRFHGEIRPTTPMGLRRTWFMASSIAKVCCGEVRPNSAKKRKLRTHRSCPRDGPRPMASLCRVTPILQVIGVGFHHVGDGVRHSARSSMDRAPHAACAASAAITASSTSRLEERGIVAITAPSLGPTSSSRRPSGPRAMRRRWR